MATRIQIAKRICRTKMPDEKRDELLSTLYGLWSICDKPEADDNYFFQDQEDDYQVYRIESRSKTFFKDGQLVFTEDMFFRALETPIEEWEQAIADGRIKPLNNVLSNFYENRTNPSIRAAV